MKIAAKLIDSENGIVLHLARVEDGEGARTWWLCDPESDGTSKSTTRESARSVIEQYLIGSDKKVKQLITYGEKDVLTPAEAAATFADLKMKSEKDESGNGEG